MAHFAQIDKNNVVHQVIVVVNDVIIDENGNESEQLGIDFLKNLYGENTQWVQTSYNGSFRKNYASPGCRYDVERDAFIPRKQWNSWILNEETCRWEPPVPIPDETNQYAWNEDNLEWVLLENL